VLCGCRRERYASSVGSTKYSVQTDSSLEFPFPFQFQFRLLFRCIIRILTVFILTLIPYNQWLNHFKVDGGTMSWGICTTNFRKK